MLQHLILAAFIVVIAFLQPAYPSLENLIPITAQNAASLIQVAAIGSDTLDNVLWSPDGKTLAVVTGGHVFVYNMTDMSEPYLTIPRRFDEAVSYETEDNDFIWVGDTDWHIPSKLEAGFGRNTSFESFDRQLIISSSAELDQLVINLLNRSSRKEIHLKTGISGQLEQVVFSPESRYAVFKITIMSDTLYGPQRAQLWDLDRGTLVATLDQALETIDLIAFHANGRLLVTTSTTDAAYGSIFEDVRVWDVVSGKQVGQVNETSYLPVRFSPDKELMVFCVNNNLSLWSDHEIGLLGYIPPDTVQENPTYDYPENPLFSPDGSKLLAVFGRQILIWETKTALSLGKPRFVLENENYTQNYFFSADGRKLIVQSTNGNLRIWDMTQPTPEVTQVLADITDLQISPDGQWLWGYTNQRHNRILIYVDTGEVLQKLPDNALLDPLWRYAAYWSQGKINLVELASDKVFHLNPLPDYIGTAAYQDVKEGRIVFTTGNGIKVYDLNSGEMVFSYVDQYHLANQYTVSTSGKILLVVYKTNYTTIGILDIKQLDMDQALFSFTTPYKDPNFFLLPDEKTLAYTASASSVQGENIDYADYSQFEMWDIATGVQQAQYMVKGYVQASAVNTVKHLLAFGSTTRFKSATLNLIDLTQPQALLHPIDLPSYDDPVFDDLQFSPNGQYLASTVDYQSYGDGPVSHDYELMVFDVKQLQEQNRLSDEKPFVIRGGQSSLFSPDNQFLFVYAQRYPNGEFELWELKNKVKLASLVGDGIAAFSSDSTLLAVHDRYQTEIYSTNALASGSVNPLITITDIEGQVKNLVFSADGKRLYLVEEARVRVYGVS